MSQAHQVLSDMVSGASSVFYDPDRNGGALQRDHPVLDSLLSTARMQPLRPMLHAMRWRKSPGEVALLQRSADAAAAGLLACMCSTAPGVPEFGIASLFGEAPPYPDESN